jgi:hypothetical protein
MVSLAGGMSNYEDIWSSHVGRAKSVEDSFGPSASYVLDVLLCML